MDSRTSVATPLQRITRGVVVVVLLSMLVSVGALVLAWRSTASAKRGAESAAQKVAGVWLRDFLEIATLQSQLEWHRILLPAFEGNPNEPDTIAASMMQAAHELPEDCGCSRIVPSYVFVMNLATGRIAIGGASNPVLRSRAEARIRSKLSSLRSTPPDPMRILTLSGADTIESSTNAWMIEFKRFVLRQQAMVVGLEVPLSALGPEVLAPAHRALLSAYKTDTVNSPAYFSLRISHANGQVLYASTPQFSGAAVVSIPFWDDANPNMVATLALNPATLARVLPGGVPAVPTALILSISILLATLGALGVLLLRRAGEVANVREHFATSVTHEIRTPLTQILLYAESLELGRSANPARGASIIAREARRLIRLVDNVMHLAKVNRATPQVQLEMHDLKPIVDATLAELASFVAQRNMTLEVTVPAGLGVIADAAALDQIIRNLVDNAIRYGTPNQTIHVGATSIGKSVILTVADEGPGIAVADRERIWQPYVRLVNAKVESGGLGIGLAIVAQLANAMGAVPSVRAGSAGGAVFEITLRGVPLE